MTALFFFFPFPFPFLLIHCFSVPHQRQYRRTLLTSVVALSPAADRERCPQGVKRNAVTGGCSQLAGRRRCPRCFCLRLEGEKGRAQERKETALGRREQISPGHGGDIPGALEVGFSLCDAEHLLNRRGPSLALQFGRACHVLLGLWQILRRGNQLHQPLRRGICC